MCLRRIRRGFQADHSSSSYLFYAIDRPVSARGREVAHRYSSRAEVQGHTARYLKWGDSSLSHGAYEALLAEHYDVMASESYGWWTLMIAFPKTPQMKALLAPFSDARGADDLGVDVEEYGKRLVAIVYCQFQSEGAEIADHEEDTLAALVDLLAQIRAELMEGDASFLQAVASFYDAWEDGDEAKAEDVEPTAAPRDDMTKTELQQECTARGVEFRKTWTKAQLRDALESAGRPKPKPKSKSSGEKARLSKAARTIVDQLERV